MVLPGALLGLGCGLKPTMASFVVAAALSLVLVGSRSMKERFRTSVVWSGGAFLAILVSSGPWMAVLSAHYGSPIFPFANHIIGSPYGPAESFADIRFRPDGLGEFVSFPFQFAVGGEVAWEFAFRDLRLSLLCVLLVAYGLRVLSRRGAERAVASPTPAEAPVTSATRPDNSLTLMGYSIRRRGRLCSGRSNH